MRRSPAAASATRSAKLFVWSSSAPRPDDRAAAEPRAADALHRHPVDEHHARPGADRHEEVALAGVAAAALRGAPSRPRPTPRTRSRRRPRPRGAARARRRRRPVSPSRSGFRSATSSATESSASAGSSRNSSAPAGFRRAILASVAPTSTPTLLAPPAALAAPPSFAIASPVPPSRGAASGDTLRDPKGCGQGEPDVRRVLRPAREALRALARPPLPVPRRLASRGARPPALRHRAGRGLHRDHGRGRHRQDDALPHAAPAHRARHRGRVHLQPAALGRGAAAGDQRRARPRDRGAGPPPAHGAAEPLPAREEGRKAAACCC